MNRENNEEDEEIEIDKEAEEKIGKVFDKIGYTGALIWHAAILAITLVILYFWIFDPIQFVAFLGIELGCVVLEMIDITWMFVLIAILMIAVIAESVYKIINAVFEIIV